MPKNSDRKIRQIGHNLGHSGVAERRTAIIVVGILMLGLILRMAVSLIGHNFDMDSYMIVAKIIDRGGNVYSETHRYNYGPIWFHMIHYMWKVSLLLSADGEAFRYIVTAVLACVDFGICLILWRVYGIGAAILFSLNPISIIITGYHSQFGNLAILIGLCSALLFGDDVNDKLNLKKISGLTLLGFSMMTKHLLFLFPVWLSAKQKGVWQKCIVLLLPVCIFLFGFLPYWETGKSGIIQNVFLYKSLSNGPFWNMLLPGTVWKVVPKIVPFFGMLILLGFLFRKQKLCDSLIIYTAALVIFSSAMTNQYLAIVTAFVSLYLNWALIVYVVIGTYHLLTDMNGICIEPLRHATPWFLLGNMNYYYLVLFLFIGSIWAFSKKKAKISNIIIFIGVLIILLLLRAFIAA